MTTIIIDTQPKLIDLYARTFSIFLSEPLPKEYLESYVLRNVGDEEKVANYDPSPIINWILDHADKRIKDYTTGIGILEAVEHLIQCAIENANLKIEQTCYEKQD